MPLNKNFVAAGAAVVMLMWVSSAQAGFEWTPPAKQVSPAAVPPVEAEPLDETPPAVEAAVPAHAAAAPVAETPSDPAQEPVLKVKTITPAQADNPAPNPGMGIPQNPGLASPSAKTEAPVTTVSVPHQVNDAPLAAPPAVPALPVPAKAAEAAAPAPAMPPAATIPAEKKPGLTINPYPLAQGEKPPVKASAPAISAPTPQADLAGDYAVVEGFGSDMALALALREVVPPHYSFSFAKGVNPGYRVSWNGGKPWNQVVREMVAPLNLAYEIRGNTVVIKPATADTAPAPEKRVDAAPEAVPMAQPATQKAPEQITWNAEKTSTSVPPSESKIETASGEEVAALEEIVKQDATKPVPVQIKEAPALKKPETIQLSSADSAAPRIWEAKQGASLKETLAQWSKEAGINLQWNAKQDYKVDSGVLINGTFENAVKVLFMHGMSPTAAPRHNINTAAGSLLIEDSAS